VGNFDFYPERMTFGHLLAGLFRVEIPKLQRPFAWKKEQALDFVADIRRLMARQEQVGTGVPNQEPPPHLFGTIVLVTSKAPGAPYMVIDGQQRLTTVTVTLGLIEAEARRLLGTLEDDDSPDAVKAREELEDLARTIHGALWLKPLDFDKPEQPRLISPSVTQKTYEEILRGTPLKNLIRIGKVEPVVRLLTVAGIIDRELIASPEEKTLDLRTRVHQLKLLKLSVLDLLLFISISTSSQDAGYELFEVLNSRGEPLNSMDHLKTWILAKMQGHELQSKIYDVFQPLTELEHGIQQAYLACYYKAKMYQGFGKEDPKNNARTFRKDIFRDPVAGFIRSSDDAENTEDELQANIVRHAMSMNEWLGAFTRLRKGEWPYLGKENNQLEGRFSLWNLVTILKCQIAAPVLLQAANRIAPTEFRDLVRCIEMSFFRYKTICGQHAGSFEKVLLDIAKQVEEGDLMPVVSARTKLQALLDTRASDKVFASRLAEELQYKPGDKAKLVKYFLWNLERSLTKGGGVIADMSTFEVEHVSPQTPPTGKPITNVHRLGNLCMLTSEEHDQLSNKPYPAKRKIIQDREKLSPPKRLFVTSSRELFDNNSSWDEQKVDQRTVALCQKAVEVFRAVSH